MVFQLPSYLLPHPTIIANTTYADAIVVENQTFLESLYSYVHFSTSLVSIFALIPCGQFCPFTTDRNDMVSPL